MATPRADIGAEAVAGATAIPGDSLAAAVLRMAIDDLEAPQRLCRDDDEAMANLQEAREFCFSLNPESRYWREFWCEVAGVDQQYFQKLAAQRCRASLR